MQGCRAANGLRSERNDAAEPVASFLYNANRSRVVHLSIDAVNGTDSAATPKHYSRKKVYGLGPQLEADYEPTASFNPSVPQAPSGWALKKLRIYVPGPEGTAGTMEFNPQQSFDNAESALVYHYDHLGSIERITPHGSTSTNYVLDGQGKPSRYSYDAWGQRRNADTWSGAPITTADGGSDDATPRGYTGHEMLDDLGLVHMNGRIYDPLLGRFLSADLLVSNPGSLQSFNRYSYCGNNPISTTDPSGFETAADEEARKKREEEAQKKRAAAESDARGEAIAKYGIAGYAAGMGSASINAAGIAASATTAAADQVQPSAMPSTALPATPTAPAGDTVDPKTAPTKEKEKTAPISGGGVLGLKPHEHGKLKDVINSGMANLYRLGEKFGKEYRVFFYITKDGEFGYTTPVMLTTPTGGVPIGDVDLPEGARIVADGHNHNVSYEAAVGEQTSRILARGGDPSRYALPTIQQHIETQRGFSGTDYFGYTRNGWVGFVVATTGEIFVYRPKISPPLPVGYFPGNAPPRSGTRFEWAPSPEAVKQATGN